MPENENPVYNLDIAFVPHERILIVCFRMCTVDDQLLASFFLCNGERSQRLLSGNKVVIVYYGL